MTLSRTKFFLLAAILLLSVVLAPKIIWLARSQQTRGVMAFEGRGDAGEQIPLRYSVVYFRIGRDTIWFKGLGNLRLHEGESIPIRYNASDPPDAKIDIFAGIWGDTLVYGSTPMLMLLVMFLHPTLVPRRSRLRLTKNRPFVLII